MDQEVFDRTQMLHALATERYWRLEMQGYVHAIITGLAVGFLGTEALDCTFGGFHWPYLFCVPLWVFNLIWNGYQWAKVRRLRQHQKNLMDNLSRFLMLYQTGASDILMQQAVSQVDAAMKAAINAK